MACACNKNRSATGLTAKRAETPSETKARESREAQMNARAASGSRANVSQSFALEMNGKTASFGSRLERDAAIARTGARPL